MAVYRTFRLECDSCADETEGHGSNSLAESRKFFAFEGWRRVAGKDLCGVCVEQLPATEVLEWKAAREEARARTAAARALAAKDRAELAAWHADIAAGRRPRITSQAARERMARWPTTPTLA